jgi:hypothetical protein
VPFLVDTGADFTVVSYTVAMALSTYFLPTLMPQAISMGGMNTIQLLDAGLVFLAADGRGYGFQGPIQALASPSTLALSVLGRDIIERFQLIYDRTQGNIVLLSPPDALPLP